VAEWLGLITQ